VDLLVALPAVADSLQMEPFLALQPTNVRLSCRQLNPTAVCRERCAGDRGTVAPYQVHSHACPGLVTASKGLVGIAEGTHVHAPG